MKRFTLCVIILMLCLLTACTDGGRQEGDNDMDETEKVLTEETASETVDEVSIFGVSPGDYHRFVKFDLPEDFRKAAVDYMRKQAGIEWTPGQTFKTGRQNEHWGFELEYTEGKTYTGLLYATKKTSIDEFQISLDRNGGKYTSEKFDYSFTLGVDCNTAITHSLQQFTNAVTGKAETLMPSYADLFGGVTVGDYTVPDGARQTAKIIAANTPETIYKAYSQLDAGDIIITKNEDTKVNHLRMVVEKPTVVTTATGKIVPGRSYVVTIEQTDSFDSKRTDGVNTTWWVDHQYTFDKLFEKNYVPVSVEAYRTGAGTIPYLALDDEITAEMLSKGVFTGTVSSNYPIRFVLFDLYKKDGGLIKSTVFNGEFDSRKVNLRKYASEIFTGDIESGEYTLVITAGVSRGSTELFKTDFVYNK